MVSETNLVPIVFAVFQIMVVAIIILSYTFSEPLYGRIMFMMLANTNEVYVFISDIQCI